MKIRLLIFSTLRNHFGTAEREIELAAPRTAAEIFLGLFEDQEAAKQLFRSVRCAVNCEYVPPETLVHDGDELAFIPPVSGG